MAIVPLVAIELAERVALLSHLRQQLLLLALLGQQHLTLTYQFF